MRFKVSSFCIGVLLFVSNLICSQESKQEFQFVSIKEGISKVGVSCIIQDKFGFIWIGTRGTGLYKFDGIDYTNYKHELQDTTSLSSSRIVAVFIDSNERLWVGTENGLCFYNRDLDEFTRVVLDEANRKIDNEHILSLEEDANQNLLVGTIGLGLYTLNINSLKTNKILESSISDTYEEIHIKNIKYTKQGKTFVATNFGLKEIDLINNRLIDSKLFVAEMDFFDIPIETMFLSDNYLWIGAQNNKGVYKCKLSNDSNNHIENIENFYFTTKKIMTIKELPNKTILIGTENDGLFHIKNNGEVIKNYVASKSEESTILHNSIWALFVDIEGRIWMGYYNSGVAVSDDLYDKFHHIKNLPNTNNSLKAGSVMSVEKDRSGKLWLATDGGGIDIYDPQKASFTHINSTDTSNYTGLTSDYIEVLFIDSKENIWAGSWQKGLYFLKKGERSFVNFNKENTNGKLASNIILSIAEDHKGIIWIGAFNNGLHSYNPKTKTFKRYNYGEFIAAGFDSPDIRKIFIDSENIIWIGTPIGLYKLKEKNDGSFDIRFMGNKMIEKYNNPSNANHILSIYECSNNKIWIGTRGAGLCMYDKKTDAFTWYNKSTGLLEENVAAIIEDNQGFLWVSGNSGLTKINLEKSQYRNFTYNDGLLSNDFNFGSVFKDDKGVLYFGNFKGVDYFKPTELKVNKKAPIIYLKQFKLFNEKTHPLEVNSPLVKVISATDSISLTHNQSVFTIEYSGINFTRPEKNSYAYYLEGYENTWNYVGNKRSATYTNLDNGNYVFKLMAANNDGVWNKEPLSLIITVLPPWWKSKIAIISYMLFFALCLYLLNYLTQKRINEREILNTERIQQQQKDDLNKKKIQFFTNISHEFRTPLTLIINPLKDIINSKEFELPATIKNKLAIIYKNTDRLYRLINELMDLRKLELNKMNVRAQKIHLIDFTKNIISYFEEEASSKNILLSLDADVSDIVVWGDAKMLEKIIFNLLSNAIKVTTKGGTISVVLESSDKLHLLPLVDKNSPVKIIEIKISDTGLGMPSDQKEKIFERFYQVERQNESYIGGTGIGLEVVQNFVHLHKGKIDLDTKLGEGTTFKIKLPEGNNHFKSEEIAIGNEDFEIRSSEYLPTGKIELSEEKTIKSEPKKLYKILIIEDNLELKEYLKTELSKQYKVFLASNGKEGLNVVKQAYPDVIITDVIMPEMDGFEFCKMVKDNPSTSHIPLLMLTAKATIENRIEGIETGADAYMVKPFDLKLLKLRLSQLIKSRELIFEKYFGAISGSENSVNATSIDKEFIENLLKNINKNISNPNLSVEELASLLNLSRSQLYRKIKALTGQTVNEFLRRIRLERAKHILENGSANISEACYNVGFSSPSYFAKCFKAHFGVLPSEIEIKK
ncbi:response regulator [Polaribacter batillariae]|uniref:histidine kinase n=1 Tax=Polaribacter batillariae TaxID=2808900 RepID=A0ABX7SYA5_9FLAO|nr:two-component regulator propeller domain-containing protein [Polaribacter batillariae]QTD38496.1 response regulator [Polaribacter batillariae]